MDLAVLVREAVPNLWLQHPTGIGVTLHADGAKPCGKVLVRRLVAGAAVNRERVERRGLCAVSQHVRGCVAGEVVSWHYLATQPTAPVPLSFT
jgi:hypothetical protein